MAAGLVDASSAATEIGAAAIAAQFGHAVVADADTTQTEQVSALPDGSFELTESSQPVRVQQADSWVPVDTNLVALQGMWNPRASAVPVRFSAGGSGPLAQVQAPDGSWLSETWAAGPLPVPSVSGSTATYAAVFPGVDLKLTATATGMSSVLVIASAVAASDPRLAAVTFGVTGTSVAAVAGTDASGSAALETANGLTAASPSWWDSSQPGSTSAAPGGVGIAQPVTESIAPSALTLDVAAAAQTAGTVFPVYVDPDWTGRVQARTFTDSAYPSESYWNGAGASDSRQHVGYVQAEWSDDHRPHTAQSFWRMDLSGVRGKVILKATFDTEEVYAPSCNKREVDLYTTDPIGPSTTWSSQTRFITKLDSQTVAYGHDSSCPAHSVGFTATSGVGAAAANSSTITLGLKVPDKALDTYSWKKFNASATLVVDYDTVPSVPSGLGISSCTSFVCSSPAFVNDTTPTLTARSTDADGGNLNYTFEIVKGQPASASAPYYRTGTASNVPQGRTASYTPSALPAGAYEFRVHVSDGIRSAVADSSFFRFTIDTTAPAAPKISVSGGLSTTATAPAGTVGATTESVTISPSSSADDAWGYAYAILPATSTVTFPTNLTCNTSVGGYTTVCPGLVNAGKTVTITAPEDTSTFAAITFDAAGNTHGPSSSKVTFSALADRTSVAAGHSWTTHTAASSAACPGAGQVGPVLDAATTGGQDVVMSATACWGYDGAAPGSNGSIGGGVLSFDGSTAANANTLTAVLDTTKPYTVGAWVYPTDSDAGYHDVLGQNGGNESAFVLQENAGSSWSFCVTAADTSTWTGHCASSPAGSVEPGEWMFLVGQYNPTDHTVTLRLSNLAAGSAGTDGGPGLRIPIVASTPGSFAARGPIQLGGGLISGADRPWLGEVMDPFAIQGIADLGQLEQLMHLTAPRDVTYSAGR